MRKSLRSSEYERLVDLLIAARKNAGIRQSALADAFGKSQSFIAKYEGGERRIDLIELVAIARALGIDPLKLLRNFLAGETAKTSKKSR